MVEEVKEENKQDNKDPQNSGGIVGRDEKGKFTEGHEKIGGRVKGTVSIMTKIKQYLREHPEKLEELVTYYLNDLDSRDLLLRMIDGMPRQRVGVGGLDEEGELTSITYRVIRSKEDLKMIDNEQTS